MAHPTGRWFSRQHNFNEESIPARFVPDVHCNKHDEGLYEDSAGSRSRDNLSFAEQVIDPGKGKWRRFVTNARPPG